jgi:positive regulator of sigma E activity
MRFLERFWFGCGHCHGDGCPLAETTDTATQGDAGHGSVVAESLAVFILPLVTALAGGWLASRIWPIGGQVLGLLVGAAAGIALACVLVRWLVRDQAREGDR